ncbi:hypothetical protein SASPL_118975 [Salvia splendens]|uniref:Mitochondrial import inner membrane translocase subunit TIM50 n=1 Tax=Salvia splendens TaxID=180675 RepID=A0A8X8Y0G1_SALSN|nr:hypothetical protein SASPL_118975 [Salvia splendens]
MQTKKRTTGRNSREVASPRVPRQQRKLVENVQVQGKKVAEIITSSARKKKVVSTKSKVVKVVEESAGGTNLDAKFRLVDADDSNVCLDHQAEHESHDSSLNKSHENGAANYSADTIFSPSFHLARSDADNISSEADFYNYFRNGNPDCGKENIQIDCPGGVTLSPEVSAIYLSMKNSNLECIDENNQDHMSVDVRQEDEDADDYDDFDPYFFIKNLPDLSSVVPMFRPLLLPKQTRSCPSTSLVLDLDASQSIYAEQLLNVLDPKRKIFRHRVYRDSCLFVDGNYLKDLSVLGRDLSRVIIIDNSPQAFGFQVDNGIPIESWFDDRSDSELLLLLPFLESLVGAQDVRPLIAQKFNLREKVAAAVSPLGYNEGDPFER